MAPRWILVGCAVALWGCDAGTVEGRHDGGPALCVDGVCRAKPQGRGGSSGTPRRPNRASGHGLQVRRLDRLPSVLRRHRHYLPVRTAAGGGRRRQGGGRVHARGVFVECDWWDREQERRARRRGPHRLGRSLALGTELRLSWSAPRQDQEPLQVQLHRRGERRRVLGVGAAQGRSGQAPRRRRPDRRRRAGRVLDEDTRPSLAGAPDGVSGWSFHSDRRPNARGRPQPACSDQEARLTGTARSASSSRPYGATQ